MAEKDYYESIKDEVEKLFRNKNKKVHFEITNKGFSTKLKDEIRKKGRDILFYFLKGKGSNYPDITGVIEEKYSNDFIIVEVKEKQLKLEDIYQARKYGELFDAKFILLVSLKPIPAEIKALLEKTPTLLNLCTIYKSFILAQFDAENKNIIGWFGENPFEKNFYWG